MRSVLLVGFGAHVKARAVVLTSIGAAAPRPGMYRIGEGQLTVSGWFTART